MRRLVLPSLLAALAVSGCKEPPPDSLVQATPLRLGGDGGFVRPNLGDGGSSEFVLDAADPDSLYRAGQEAFLAGDSAKAAEHFKASLRLKPSPKTWHALGDALMTQGRFGEAAEAFEDAVTLEPTKRMSWQRRARCLLNAGRPNEALEPLRKAVELKPDDPAGVRDLADGLVEAKKDAEAIELLAKATAMDASGAAKDWKLVGELYARGERWPQAVAPLKESAKLHPDPGIYSELADAQVRSGDLDGALASFEEAARLDPKDPLAPETIGELKLKKGDVAGARTAFEASLAIKARSYPHLALGRLDFKEAKKDGAKAHLDKALDLVAKALETPQPPTALANKDEDTTKLEVREIAGYAAEIGSFEASEKLLLVLAEEEDTKKDATLFLELAKVRQSKKDAKGVKEACEKVKALLPAKDKTACPPKG
ncbi:MAG TPA: tetratricopeptide repeat protein [Myxococcales bacterium]|jgi:tetratricopeptide (TPR) repeat protein